MAVQLTWKRSCVLLASLRLLTACAGDEERGVRLRTDRRAYVAGDTLVLSIRNVADTLAGYNTCVLAIERRGDLGWRVEASYPPPGAMCAGMTAPLPAAGFAVERVPLPPTLPAGSYRLRFPWFDHRTTPPFVVKPRGTQ